VRSLRIGLACAVIALVPMGCGPGPSSNQKDPNIGRYGTWSWDGSNWSQLAPSGEKPRFPGEQLFFSPVLGGLISVSYRDWFNNTTYNGTKWNGVAWVTNDASPAEPPRRGNNTTAMVLDGNNDRIIFIDPNARETLAWSPRGWTSVVSPSEWPTERYVDVEGAAYDPDRRNVLIVTCCLFVDSSLATSAWAWDGHALHVLSPSHPLVGGPFFMVPDGRGHLLAFGKDSSSSWDGVDWSPLATRANLPKDAWSVASDPAHGEIFAAGRGTPFHVWHWQDGTWNLEPTASPASGPPDGATSNLVYDPMLPGFVLTVLPEEPGGVVNLP